MSIEAMKQALEALEEIALAGMSGTGQESEEGLRDWHARQAWEFIGIAARALEPIRAILALRPAQVPMTDEQIRSMCKQGWVFETVKQWVRVIEAHHGITAQAQQPATAIACGIPGMAKTTCPYCEQGFAFEYEQPATGEPVVSRNPFASRCYTMSESHLSGHRLIVGFEKLGDAQDAHEWVARQGRGDFTHPAPGVPEGYVLVPIEPTQAMLNVQTWDFNRFYSPREIWAAMLAAASPTTPQPKEPS